MTHDIENEKHVVGLLCATGDPDLCREGLRDTPARVIKSYRELFAGYEMDAKKILARTFPGDGYDQVVVLSGIDFFSVCEHHLLPFFGVAHVAYLPGDRIVGLSKLARLVECFSRRLQVQERLTQQVADAMQECLAPKGVAILFEGVHSCMVSRGVQKKGATMKTCALKGVFRSDAKARSEVFSLFKHRG